MASSTAETKQVGWEGCLKPNSVPRNLCAVRGYAAGIQEPVMGSRTTRYHGKGLL